MLVINTNLLKTWCVRYLLVLLKGLPMIPLTRSPIFSAISSWKWIRESQSVSSYTERLMNNCGEGGLSIYVQLKIHSQRPRASHPGPSLSPSHPETHPTVKNGNDTHLKLLFSDSLWFCRLSRCLLGIVNLLGQSLRRRRKTLTTPSEKTRRFICLCTALSKMSLAATLQLIFSVSKNMSLCSRCPALFRPETKREIELIARFFPYFPELDTICNWHIGLWCRLRNHICACVW